MLNLAFKTPCAAKAYSMGLQRESAAPVRRAIVLPPLPCRLSCHWLDGNDRAKA